jgi:hypothetical protein
MRRGDNWCGDCMGENTVIKPKYSSPRSQNFVIGYCVELSQLRSKLHNVFFSHSHIHFNNITPSKLMSNYSFIRSFIK